MESPPTSPPTSSTMRGIRPSPLLAFAGALPRARPLALPPALMRGRRARACEEELPRSIDVLQTRDHGQAEREPEADGDRRGGEAARLVRPRLAREAPEHEGDQHALAHHLQLAELVGGERDALRLDEPAQAGHEELAADQHDDEPRRDEPRRQRIRTEEHQRAADEDLVDERVRDATERAQPAIAPGEPAIESVARRRD